MQNVIEWYRNVIQHVHAYQWGGLGQVAHAGGRVGRAGGQVDHAGTSGWAGTSGGAGTCERKYEG